MKHSLFRCLLLSRCDSCFKQYCIEYSLISFLCPLQAVLLLLYHTLDRVLQQQAPETARIVLPHASTPYTCNVCAPSSKLCIPLAIIFATAPTSSSTPPCVGLNSHTPCHCCPSPPSRTSTHNPPPPPCGPQLTNKFTLTDCGSVASPQTLHSPLPQISLTWHHCYFTPTLSQRQTGRQCVHAAVSPARVPSIIIYVSPG
jgi:hypothetical protein